MIFFYNTQFEVNQVNGNIMRISMYLLLTILIERFKREVRVVIGGLFFFIGKKI